MKCLCLFVVSLGLAGCATMPRPSIMATANLLNANNQPAGTATFTEVSGGVRMVVQAKGLPPGPHGLHIHEVGKCEAPTFTTAGGHFNPDKKQHGMQNPAGPHAGDLPNITIGPEGHGWLETLASRITLRDGPVSLFDTDGSAIVIHAAPDDYTTDPTGNSGDRIACGVIMRTTPLG